MATSTRMIIKAKLLTDSELGYIGQLIGEDLLNAGVATHTRLTRLIDISLWLENGDTCGCCGAKLDDSRLVHWADCPVVLARQAVRKYK